MHPVTSELGEGRRIISLPPERLTRPGEVYDRSKERNGKNSVDGKGMLKLLDLYNNPTGRVDTIDAATNELITLRRGAKVVEFMGMVKGGKSKHIVWLKERLEQDEELTRINGRAMKVEIFKPNSLIKVLFEKDPNTRALYNEAIIHLHGLALNMLYLSTKGDVDVATRDIDLAILDRGPNDDMVWTNALHDYRGLLSVEERDRQLAMARGLEKYIDLAIGINVSPELAIQREGEREGNVMNRPFLGKLFGRYHQISENPLTLDTSYLDIDGNGEREENREKVYRKVMGLYTPQNTEELRGQR